jgi:hypothetical protein
MYQNFHLLDCMAVTVWPASHIRSDNTCNQFNRVICYFVTNNYKIIYYLHFEEFETIVNLMSSTTLRKSATRATDFNPALKCKFSS